MDVYDTLYAVLDANDGKIRGRTTIQKVIYLSYQVIPEDLDIPQYVPHYYGPFSPGLRRALENMVHYSFLYEATIPGVMYEGYRYGLTEDGREIAEESKAKYNDVFEKVAKIVDTCRQNCNLKAAPLSYAAKIHHLYSAEPSSMISFQAAVDYAKGLGWYMSENDVEVGTQLLKKLGLDKP